MGSQPGHMKALWGRGGAIGCLVPWKMIAIVHPEPIAAGKQPPQPLEPDTCLSLQTSLLPPQGSPIPQRLRVALKVWSSQEQQHYLLGIPVNLNLHSNKTPQGPLLPRLRLINAGDGRKGRTEREAEVPRCEIRLLFSGSGQACRMLWTHKTYFQFMPHL